MMLGLSHPRIIIQKKLRIQSSILFPTLPLLQRKNELPFLPSSSSALICLHHHNGMAFLHPQTSLFWRKTNTRWRDMLSVAALVKNQIKVLFFFLHFLKHDLFSILLRKIFSVKFADPL
ncbi:hypothetical protein GYH30_045307 [Glycine max]|nr:hypothetical protein GYH30_045307 [Glycine max]